MAILSFLTIGIGHAQELIPVSEYHLGRYTLNSIFIQGQYAYLGKNEGLEILNISNPYAPSSVSIYQSARITDIIVSGDYAYIISEEAFYVLDISSPETPILRGSYDMNGVPGYKFIIYSNYAYIINAWRNIEIVDISDPDSLSNAGYMTAEDDAFDECVIDSLLYVAIPSQDLFIFDLSVPQYPGYLGRFDFGSGGPWTVLINENYVYCLTGYQYTLKIANITDPIHPYLVGSYLPSQTAFHVALSGNFAFLSEDTAGIEVINVIDPSTPYFVTRYNTPGHTDELIAEGQYLYVGDGTSFLILRFDPTDIEDNNNLPEAFALSQNYPNPFNAQTTISYSLPIASEVRIDIFDILGRKVETLLEGMKLPGNYKKIWDASNQGSGVYFYRINAGGVVETKKMILLK